MAPSIFISYRRDDAGGHAGRIFDRLRHWFDDNEIFFDVNTLDTGDVFPEHIDKAIRSTTAVLVVIGPDWLKALNQRAEDSKIDFVRREIAVAIERQRAGKAEVLPVLVGGATRPSCNDLHENVRRNLAGCLTIKRALSLLIKRTGKTNLNDYATASAVSQEFLNLFFRCRPMTIC